MTRKPITPITEATTLLKSRRRCCICFGLNRDTSLKQGQIAHLDSDSANGTEDNLAFLCLDHHDQYDSRTSQSKNLTLIEVKQYRAELYAEIKLAFGTEIRFGNAQGVVDLIPGHYIREGDYESADIKVERMKDGRYHITGLALWGKNRQTFGPHTGRLDFIGELEGQTIQYVHFNFDGKKYRAVLSFSDDGLTVSEIKRDESMFGMNVSFKGEYKKAK
jgi:hypothetical protein